MIPSLLGGAGIPAGELYWTRNSTSPAGMPALPEMGEDGALTATDQRGARAVLPEEFFPEFPELFCGVLPPP